MSSRRTARVAQAIRETVSSSILFELRDPRIRNVTVLSAEVSGDLRNAKVHVSVMGNPKVQSLTMHGLNAARGFLQAKVADRLQTKVTPVLQFVMDTGVQKSIEAARLLRELLPEGTGAESETGASPESASDFDEDADVEWDGSDDLGDGVLEDAVLQDSDDEAPLAPQSPHAED